MHVAVVSVACSSAVFFFNDTATTEIYTYLHTLSLHDALPIYIASRPDDPRLGAGEGIGRRVRREHAAHQRLMLLALAGADAVGPGLFVAHATHVALRGAKKKRARRKGAREGRYDARVVCTI